MKTAPTLIAFERMSYRSQISRLRKLALAALKNYSINVRSIEFINHGENTTFKITSTAGKKFLLRIHRNDYHSLNGLQEELKWLERLNREHVLCPKPIKSRKSKLVVKAEAPAVGERNCTLLTFTQGRFFEKGLTEKVCFKWGALLAKLQLSGQFQVKHRRYWTADGLVGLNARFGSVNKIKEISEHDQRILLKVRKKLHAKIRYYERHYSHRMGLIHADLHFGNFFETRDGFFAIDFDDCGYGFHAYDVSIPVLNIIYASQAYKQKKKIQIRIQAFLRGYRSAGKTWDETDDEMLKTFLAARTVMMIGWINSRKDNPKIYRLLKVRTRRTIRFLTEYNLI